LKFEFDLTLVARVLRDARNRDSAGFSTVLLDLVLSGEVDDLSIKPAFGPDILIK
jgi:hypothetical protein